MTGPKSVFLVLPRLQVLNANAMSSPISVGFPAVTGFMGAVHHLERTLKAKGLSGQFTGVGIISHDAQLQTILEHGSYQRALMIKGLGINKDGSFKSFIPSARIHMTVSLVIEVAGFESHELAIKHINKALMRLRIAGGDITGHEPPYFCVNTDERMERLSINALMPGYALVDRSHLMRESMLKGLDAIDSLLDFLALHNLCLSQEGSTRAYWHREKRHPGWLVPVGVGFQGLNPLGSAVNVRDESVPHRFAQGVVSLGEFLMVHKVSGLDELMWRYDTTSFDDLYLCVSDQALHGNNKN